MTGYKCGQLPRGRSPFRSLKKNIYLTIMVKGGFLYFSMFVIAILKAPHAFGLEEQTKKFAFNTNGLGAYSFEYETTGGTYRREDGGIVSDPGGDSLVVRGEYGYIDPEGKHFALKYVADSNGYHPIFGENDVRFNDRRII